MWRPIRYGRRLHHWHEYKPGHLISACGRMCAERDLVPEHESRIPKCKLCEKAIARWEAQP